MTRIGVLLCFLLIIVTIIGGSCASPTPSPAPSPTPAPAQETPTAAPTPTSGETIKLVMANWTSTKNPPPFDWDTYDYMINAWCDTIEEESGGRIEFERFPGASLVSMFDALDAVKKGTCDVTIVIASAFPGQFPLTSALALPSLFPDCKVASMVTQKLFEEGYFADEWKDVKMLWNATNSPADVCNRIRPIEKLEDWKGIKVAVTGEPETSSVKALGAVPVGIPLPEQFLALERGTVDASWLEFQGAVSFKFTEVTKYRTEAKGGIKTLHWVMNPDTYNDLPADIKSIIDKNSGMLWSLMTGAHFDTNNLRAIIFMEEYDKEHGNPPTVFLSPEELARWKKAWEPVYDEFIGDIEAKGLPAQEMIDRAGILAERYTGYKLGDLYSRWAK